MHSTTTTPNSSVLSALPSTAISSSPPHIPPCLPASPSTIRRIQQRDRIENARGLHPTHAVRLSEQLRQEGGSEREQFVRQHGSVAGRCAHDGMQQLERIAAHACGPPVRDVEEETGSVNGQRRLALGEDLAGGEEEHAEGRR